MSIRVVFAQVRDDGRSPIIGDCRIESDGSIVWAKSDEETRRACLALGVVVLPTMLKTVAATRNDEAGGVA